VGFASCLNNNENNKEKGTMRKKRGTWGKV